MLRSQAKHFAVAFEKSVRLNEAPSKQRDWREAFRSTPPSSRGPVSSACFFLICRCVAWCVQSNCHAKQLSCSKQNLVFVFRGPQ